MNDSMINNSVSPPRGETMQSTQILYEAPVTFKRHGLLYFDHNHRHQCSYPNYKLPSQYFCDHMSDRNNTLWLKRLVCEAVSYLNASKHTLLTYKEKTTQPLHLIRDSSPYRSEFSSALESCSIIYLIPFA